MGAIIGHVIQEGLYLLYLLVLLKKLV